MLFKCFYSILLLQIHMNTHINFISPECPSINLWDNSCTSESVILLKVSSFFLKITIESITMLMYVLNAPQLLHQYS